MQAELRASLIELDLIDGFGVEDIAVRHQIPVQVVRDEVKLLRVADLMETINKARRERWLKTSKWVAA